MILRPTVLNTCTGYLPFYGSNCGLKGAAILHNWLPCAIQYCGSQALAVPFCFAAQKIMKNFKLSAYPTGKCRSCGANIGTDIGADIFVRTSGRPFMHRLLSPYRCWNCHKRYIKRSVIWTLAIAIIIFLVILASN